MDHPQGCGTRPLAGCLILMVGMVITFSVFIIGFDARCHYELNRLLPRYPGSELVYEDYNFFRPFGIGRTIIHLHSDEEFLTVGSYYGTIRLNVISTRRLSTGRHSAVRAEDGGTDIYLIGACMQSNTFSP